MTDKLKPVRCGCGGEADSHMSFTYEYYVMCYMCGTRSDYYTKESEAVTAWNRAMGADQFREVTKKIERKKGKWQRRKGSDCWECSECHAVLENSDVGNHNFYYCYHCGADMMNKSGYMDIEEVHYE